MEVGETHTLGCQAIERGRFHRATVTADVLPAQIISQQDHNIGCALAGQSRCRSQQDNAESDNLGETVVRGAMLNGCVADPMAIAEILFWRSFAVRVTVVGPIVRRHF